MQQSSAKIVDLAMARAQGVVHSPVRDRLSPVQLLALAHGDGALSYSAKKPLRTRNLVALIVVALAHVGMIYWMLQHQRITPPQLETQPPMMVSLIAPPAPKPEIVPVVAPPKPVVKPKPKPKKVVKEIKPIEQPVEKPVEATAEETPKEPPVETPPETPPPAPKVPEVKAPPAKPIVEEKIEPPKFGVAYLNNPAPAYPKMSRRAGEEGRVILRVLVSETGAPKEVTLETSSGFVRLDEAALTAVKQWRFIPARKNNENLSAQVLVPIKFSLEN